jgi:hypothetical protein
MANMTADERKDLARKGGHLGGKVRAQKLSAERRREIAANAALTRWRRRRNPPKSRSSSKTAKPRLREKLIAESGPPIYRDFQRIARELERALCCGTIDNFADLCQAPGNELWNLVKRPENLGFPPWFSNRLRELTDKGCSSTHLIVHSALYGMLRTILGRQHPDQRRRELVIPGVRLTRAQLNKQLGFLQEAAKIAEALWAALGTDNNMVLFKSITRYADVLQYTPILLSSLCECAKATTGRNATALASFRQFRDMHLILLARHVETSTARFHWDALADLVDPWTDGETVTADVLRLRFSRCIRQVSPKSLDSWIIDLPEFE